MLVENMNALFPGLKNFSNAGLKESILAKKRVTWLTMQVRTAPTAMARVQVDNVKASKVLIVCYAPVAKYFSKIEATTQEK